jgi:hypothetical protein
MGRRFDIRRCTGCHPCRSEPAMGRELARGRALRPASEDSPPPSGAFPTGEERLLHARSSPSAPPSEHLIMPEAISPSSGEALRRRTGVRRPPVKPLSYGNLVDGRTKPFAPRSQTAADLIRSEIEAASSLPAEASSPPTKVLARPSAVQITTARSPSTHRPTTSYRAAEAVATPHKAWPRPTEASPAPRRPSHRPTAASDRSAYSHPVRVNAATRRDRANVIHRSSQVVIPSGGKPSRPYPTDVDGAWGNRCGQTRTVTAVPTGCGRVWISC